MSALPEWNDHWLTVREFARMMGRSPQCMQKWIHDGTLLEFGFPVWKCRSHFRKDQYFIYSRQI